MGSLWRSEEMKRVQLFIQHDAAIDTIDELGELGAIQFVDLHPETNAFSRTFINEVRRCDEMERKLRYLHEQIIREERATGVPLVTVFAEDNVDDNDINMDMLENELETFERDVKTMGANLSLLTRNNNELKEMLFVLTKDSAFFTESLKLTALEQASNDDYIPLLSTEESIAIKSTVGVNFITGVIATSKVLTFERVLWRALRGNLFFRSEKIEDDVMDPVTGEQVPKTVFIMFLQGDESRARAAKLCDTMGARVYHCPDNDRKRNESVNAIKERIDEMEKLLETSHHTYSEYLRHVSANLEKNTVGVRKHKSAYTVLNLCDCDLARRCIVAEGWCATNSLDDVLNALSIAQHRAGTSLPSVLSLVETKEEPPTSFATTEFTGQFQMIVDAYGIARYGEVNPGVFTIVTFPFLFAIMFGDFGHGIILLLASGAMIYFQEKLKKMRDLNDIFMMLFEGRFLVFTMGLFSLFTGFLYNDFFCFPINFFGSRYQINEATGHYEHTDGSVYPFGIDPVWKTSANELFYYNSLKMKMSVVVGIIQMTLGIVLGLFNHLHFKSMVDIVFGFIPQIVFMVSIFGYLIFIIVYKWMVTLDNQPFLLNVLINMVLRVGDLPDEDVLYSGQNAVQVTLVVLALVSVLLLFIPKPAILFYQHKQRSKARQQQIEAGIDPKSLGEEEEFEFAEVIIHNSIHAVEFILGCVSNTASYLRLWALSLAHAELSSVFYEQILLQTIESGNWFLVFLGLGLWGGATLAVLCCMEALSAFLHALRLHWVEFQNKFFSGDGYGFTPFSNKEVTEKVRMDMFLASIAGTQ